jgi:hypothetical protein
VRDPRRLSEEPNGGELARALREAGELGSSERVASAWQRLQPALDRVPPDPIGASTGLSALSKGALVIGTLALTTLSWFLLPVGAGFKPALSSTTPPAATPAAPAPTPTPIVALPSSPTVAPQAELRPSVTAPTPSRPAARTPRSARPAASEPTLPIAGPASALPDPEGELTLLTRAQEQLEVAPAAALALLAEHEQRYASGVLVQEREVMRIDAERALGRGDRAAARAQAFLARFPRSPQRTRLQAWLSTRSPDAPPAAEADKP